MQNGKINRWVAAAGFASLAAVLALESIALYQSYDRGGVIQPTIERWEPMLKFLFDRAG